MSRLRVGVLISGRGSNLRALLAAGADTTYPAEIVSVVSDRVEAPAASSARKFDPRPEISTPTLSRDMASAR